MHHNEKVSVFHLAHEVVIPWVAYEGYQLLIKGQVKSLIKMGLDEKLIVSDISNISLLFCRSWLRNVISEWTNKKYFHILLKASLILYVK